MDIGQGVPTHSSVPSTNRWCFQIGTVSLSSSMRARLASKASARCTAAAATTTATSPMASDTDPMDRGDRDDVVLLADAAGHLAQPRQRRRVGGVLEPDDAVVVIVVTHGADEHVDTTGPPVRHGRDHLGHIEGRLAQLDQAYDGRSRALTGTE